MVHEESFRKEPLGKFISKAAKNSRMRGRVINHSVRISSISRIFSMQDAETSKKFCWFITLTWFFYSINGPCVLCAWAINPSEKNSVRDISCSPNFPRTSIPRFTHAKHGPILYYNIACVLTLYKSY